jgi:hypothetical protein
LKVNKNLPQDPSIAIISGSVPAAKVTKTGESNATPTRGMFECDKNELNYGLKFLFMSLLNYATYK